MKTEIDVNIDAEKILNKYGLGQSKEAQKALADIVERKCRPYVCRQWCPYGKHGKDHE